MTSISETISSIPEQEKNPSILLLISVIEQQQQESLSLKEKIEVLEAEIRRLKKLPPKPKIKSNLPKDDDDLSDQGDDDTSDDTSGSESGTPKPRKRRKNLHIHKTEVVHPQNLPSGSKLLGYQDYTVQELVIEPHNILYRLARYRASFISPPK